MKCNIVPLRQNWRDWELHHNKSNGYYCTHFTPPPLFFFSLFLSLSPLLRSPFLLFLSIFSIVHGFHAPAPPSPPLPFFFYSLFLSLSPLLRSPILFILSSCASVHGLHAHTRTHTVWHTKIYILLKEPHPCLPQKFTLYLPSDPF